MISFLVKVINTDQTFDISINEAPDIVYSIGLAIEEVMNTHVTFENVTKFNNGYWLFGTYGENSHAVFNVEETTRL